MQRIQKITSHLTSTKNPAVSRVGVKSPEDVVIVSALRTPITRARKGGFADTPAEELLAAALKGVLDQSGIDPNLIEDIAVGTVLPPGSGATIARAAGLATGIPNTAALNTVNRQCSSGLQAVVQIAHEIALDQIEVGIGAGFESMTKNYGAGAMPTETSEKIFANSEAADCLIPMGITSENVAREFGITRQKQDEFSAESHRRAAEAQEKGLFKDEIIPVKVQKDGQEIVVDKDDGIRKGTTVQALAKLRPAFDENGTTTAGSSSQVSDGAAAVLLMKRKTAERYKLPIIGKFVRAAAVGVPPRIMGIGPAHAIPKVLELTGLTINDIDVFEINEAFASQAVYCIEKLGIDKAKVNPHGGAIALGHPLGDTGARQIATILNIMKQKDLNVGLTSMCVGSGMGMAAIIERES